MVLYEKRLDTGSAAEVSEDFTLPDYRPEIRRIAGVRAEAVIDGKPNFHVTLMTDVSPLCDCHDHNDMPIIPNVGFLASKDPVALDKACIDLAQQQPMVPGSVLFNESGGKKPEDIFAVANKGTHWQSHFEHADAIGLGDGRYNLIKL